MTWFSWMSPPTGWTEQYDTTDPWGDEIFLDWKLGPTTQTVTWPWTQGNDYGFYVAAMEVPAATGGGGGTTPVTTSRSTTWNVAGVLTYVTTTRSTTWNVTAPTFAGAYPATISGRKLHDQNGRQHIMFLMQSWAMAANLSNAEITTALNAVAAMGFTGVNVDPLGAVFIGGQSGWHQFTNKAGQGFFTGTPFQTSLGPAMVVDRTGYRCRRLLGSGWTCSLCLFGGYSTDGGRAFLGRLRPTRRCSTLGRRSPLATRATSTSSGNWNSTGRRSSLTPMGCKRRGDTSQGINSVEGERVVQSAGATSRCKATRRTRKAGSTRRRPRSRSTCDVLL